MAPPLALYAAGRWRTPLGDAEIDTDLARLWAEGCPLVSEDPAGHADEHSLEIQVLFLQIRNPDVRIVPLMVSTHAPASLARAGEALADAVTRSGRPALLVASTDMTHFESQAAAEVKDRRAIDAILSLDPDGLLEVVERERISMCGVAPTALVIHAAKALGATRAELVDYSTSGDVTGDRSEVVAYAGIVIS
jgi:AmmeMemoRadiSam system protein B